LVLKECAYVNADGAAVHHREGGSVAEIPEDVAGGLGDAVRPMVTGAPVDTANPTPFPDATVSVDGVDQGPGRRGKRPAAPETGDGDG
jgi:hypothetical protein